MIDSDKDIYAGWPSPELYIINRVEVNNEDLSSRRTLFFEKAQDGLLGGIGGEGRLPDGTPSLEALEGAMSHYIPVIRLARTRNPDISFADAGPEWQRLAEHLLEAYDEYKLLSLHV